jgi:hypothetical protein
LGVTHVIAVAPNIQQVKRPRINMLEALLLLVFLFIVFRLTSAAVLLVLALLYLFFPLHRSRRMIIAVCVVFFVSLALPIDMEVAGFHGPRYGSHHSRVRFVRMVKGLPAVQHCLDKYGEFIAGGCVGRGYEPTWILVWD